MRVTGTKDSFWTEEPGIITARMTSGVMTSGIMTTGIILVSWLLVSYWYDYWYPDYWHHTGMTTGILTTGIMTSGIMTAGITSTGIIQISWLLASYWYDYWYPDYWHHTGIILASCDICIELLICHYFLFNILNHTCPEKASEQNTSSISLVLCPYICEGVNIIRLEFFDQSNKWTN